MKFGPNDTKRRVVTFIDHIVPFSVLLIDLIQNRVHFSFRHLPFSFFILLTYGFVNLAVTKIRGYPVYPILTWDSLKTWALAFVLPLLQLILHTAAVYASRWRTRVYQRHDLSSSDSTQTKLFETTVVIDDDEDNNS